MTLRPPSERSVWDELRDHDAIQIAVAWVVGLTLGTLGIGLAIVIVLVIAKILGVG